MVFELLSFPNVRADKHFLAVACARLRSMFKRYRPRHPDLSCPAYLRHERRTSMLEVPRLQAMQRLSALSLTRAHAAAKAREIDKARRTEVRHAFFSKIQERIIALGAGICTVPTDEATALWEAARVAMAQASEELTSTVRRLRGMIDEAEEDLRSQKLERLVRRCRECWLVVKTVG